MKSLPDWIALSIPLKSYSSLHRSGIFIYTKFVLIGCICYWKSSAICRSIGNWEIAEPLRGRRLRAQVCGVANIHRVEDPSHWQRGNNRRVRERLTSYPTSSSSTPSAHWEDRATPYHLGIRFPAFTRWASINSLDSFCFSPIQKKPYKKIRFRVCCHSLDSIGSKF